MTDRETLEQIGYIICRLELLKGDILDLTSDEAAYYKSIFRNGDFLPRIEMYIYQVFIVKMWTILHHKETFCLRTFINAALKEGNSQRYSSATIDALKDTSRRLRDNTNAYYSKIAPLRNKIIAHLDLKHRSLDYSMNYEDDWRVLESLKDAFVKTWHITQNGGYSFRSIETSPRAEIRRLYRYSRIHEHFHRIPLPKENNLVYQIKMALLGHFEGWEIEKASPSDDAL